MTLAYGETITRQRGTATTDPYSGEQTDVSWDYPDETSIDGWGVAPTGDATQAAEPLQDGRQAVITDFELYRDEPADVLSGDRVVVRGLVCDVVGHPATWRNPFTGWEAGFVVRAKIVEG